MSPVWISTPSAFRRVAFCGERTSATTLWPRPTSCLTISPPTKPVAPVTKYFAIPGTILLRAHELPCELRARFARNVQPLDQIGDQVVGVLDARRQANQRVGQAKRGALIGWDRRVGHPRRMADQRLHAAETLTQREEAAVRHEF